MATTSKVWTVEEIKHLLETNDDMVKGSLKKLYSFQTRSEQEHGDTHEYNGVGFNSFDAPILSNMAEWYLDKGFLTHNQIKLARKKLMKYVKQLTKIANNQI